MTTTDAEVLRGKYPAKAHAARVAEHIIKQGGDASGTLYIEGHKTRMHEDSDQSAPFRQRRNFFYLTGCELPDCFYMYDIASETATLFIPPLDPEEVAWSGLPMTPEEALTIYDVDIVLTSSSVNAQLASKTTPKTTVYAIADQVSENITFLSFQTTDFSLLKPALETARILKDPYELSLLRTANAISTTAHTALMSHAKASPNERDLDALFRATCAKAGAKTLAYDPIVASGTAAATLHYVRNDQPLAGKQLLLVDAGAEVRCYAADVTRTFPIAGTFSTEARAVYEIVLEMQMRCLEVVKAGCEWEEVHLLAHRILIAGLLKLGILKGATEEELLQKRTSVAFMPHGLGHYLGMDTHDTGGGANYMDPDPMFKYLRVRGKVPAGAVITVEPGCYFCRFIVEPYLKSEAHGKYIDEEVLEKYWEVGGVRIEDDVLVTEEGIENLTTAPKGIDEMEGLVHGRVW